MFISLAWLPDEMNTMTSYEVTDVVLNSLRSSVNKNPGYFIVEVHIVKGFVWLVTKEA